MAQPAQAFHPQRIRLRKETLYRARLAIKAPTVFASPGLVKSELEKLGFQGIRIEQERAWAESWVARVEGRWVKPDSDLDPASLPPIVELLSLREMPSYVNGPNGPNSTPSPGDSISGSVLFTALTAALGVAGLVAGAGPDEDEEDEDTDPGWDEDD